MNKKNIIIFVACLILILALVLIFKDKISSIKNIDVNSSNNTNNSSNDSNTDTAISDKINKEIDFDSDDKNVNYEIDTTITLEDNNIKVNGSGAQVDKNKITINKEGNYKITGKLTNGNIIVDVDKNSTVKLLLDNATINSDTTAPIFIKKANKCIVTLKENSISSLTDGKNYVYDNASEDEPRATIYSKGDLVINGSGILNLNSNYKDAISTSDALRIFNANLNINSNDDAIRGKDYVYIEDGKIKIVSYGDGIKSTNQDSDDKGFAILKNVDLNLECNLDAITAESSVYIDGGIYNISTNGTLSNDKSKKGIKATNNIEIEAGTFEFKTADDAIHSNNIITINNGNFKITSQDDGIHSDTNLNIKNGTINILESYEGIESTNITIDNGDILVNSKDDGINIAGGVDKSSINGRVGQNKFSGRNRPNDNFNKGEMKNNLPPNDINIDTNNKLTINGGNIKVNANGDGLDSNGSIYINDGDIKVFGPTDAGNGSLDYDGECVISGGTLVTLGSSSMLQTPSDSSTQNVLAYVFDRSYNSNSNIVIKDRKNNEILNITSEKEYSAIVYSNSNIKKDETYEIYIDNTLVGKTSTENIIRKMK